MAFTTLRMNLAHASVYFVKMFSKEFLIPSLSASHNEVTLVISPFCLKKAIQDYFRGMLQHF